MTRGEAPAMRAALDQVLESTNVLFDALMGPFETLAESHPDASIGAPIEVPYVPRTSTVREVAEQVTRGGRSGWSLYQVAERENQLKAFVRDYRRGLYRATTAAHWVDMLRNFRNAILGDVHTAQQAPRGWDRLDLANNVPKRDADAADLLTPRPGRLARRQGRRGTQARQRQDCGGHSRRVGPRGPADRPDLPAQEDPGGAARSVAQDGRALGHLARRVPPLLGRAVPRPRRAPSSRRGAFAGRARREARAHAAARGLAARAPAAACACA